MGIPETILFLIEWGSVWPNMVSIWGSLTGKKAELLIMPTKCNFNRTANLTAHCLAEHLCHIVINNRKCFFMDMISMKCDLCKLFCFWVLFTSILV